MMHNEHHEEHKRIHSKLSKYDAKIWLHLWMGHAYTVNIMHMRTKGCRNEKTEVENAPLKTTEQAAEWVEVPDPRMAT